MSASSRPLHSPSREGWKPELPTKRRRPRPRRGLVCPDWPARRRSLRASGKPLGCICVIQVDRTLQGFWRSGAARGLMTRLPPSGAKLGLVWEAIDLGLTASSCAQKARHFLVAPQVAKNLRFAQRVAGACAMCRDKPKISKRVGELRGWHDCDLVALRHWAQVVPAVEPVGEALVLGDVKRDDVFRDKVHKPERIQTVRVNRTPPARNSSDA